MTDQMQLASDERRDLSELLAALTPEQWATPSLCDGWTVRDVVAHLISYEELTYLGLAGTLLRAGFRNARMNEMRHRAYAEHRPEKLIELLRSHPRPRGITAAFGGALGLTDCLIHHQDIRRPLGLLRDIQADRLVVALDFSVRAPVLPTKKNSVGLRVVATDLGWQRGDGPEVRGPGEAVLMTLAGRPSALADLRGEGVDVLATRLHPSTDRPETWGGWT